MEWIVGSIKNKDKEPRRTFAPAAPEKGGWPFLHAKAEEKSSEAPGDLATSGKPPGRSAYSIWSAFHGTGGKARHDPVLEDHDQDDKWDGDHHGSRHD
jgi:hypothetical protein